MILKILNDFCKDANQTNSSNDKKIILKKYDSPDFRVMLFYTYNPFYQFYVSSDNLKKRKDLNKSFGYQDIFTLLDDLRNRKITGHDALNAVNSFISCHANYEDLIYNIIDKNLKTRTDLKIINEVFPGLIPDFSIALANSYEDFENKVNFEQDVWFASHKLDGCRCLIFIENGNIQFYSRSGNGFLVLKNLIPEILKLNINNCVIDGEICIIDENGNEDFQSIMKEIRKKDHTIVKPKYLIFDILTTEEFYLKTSNRKLSERIEFLKSLNICSENLELLEQIQVKNKLHLQELKQISVNSNWEGLILRKDTYYQGKRSNDLLKVKLFKDDEFKVVGVEVSQFRVIKNGLEVEEEMLSNVVIEYKGNKVSVGSGFKIDERREFYKNPEKINGKIITVKYFSESINQDGSYSLRFPTFKTLHGEERDV